MKSQYNRIISSLGNFIGKWHAYIAAGLLLTMFGLALSAMVGNSAIVDEVAHIPSAYSYVHYGDYRLNPEHPPLIKDLAGIPLQFMHLKFPDNEPAWTTDANGQWESGWNFIYHEGNDADAILFWSRLPILLLAIAFGWFLYVFCRKRWGTGVALLTLFFYAFSPNLLAHSALVTTDLGASVFIFLGLVTFAYYAEKPSFGRLMLMSVGLAGAQLAKFSAFLLYPFLLVCAFVLVWIAKDPKTVGARMKTYVLGLIGSSVLSMLWVWIFYIPNTFNMPIAVQNRLIEASLPTGSAHAFGQILMRINGLPLMKALAQYLLGLTMVFDRVSGGNVTYFNGMVTNQSFHGYFPELFVFKTQIALLILIVVPLVLLVLRLFKVKNPFERVIENARTHMLEWTLGGFAVFYFVVSVAGNLNLGIRHILPVYIPLFVIVAVVTVKRLRALQATHWRKLSAAVFALLLVWYAGSTLSQHPNYLSYFNELIGGPQNADKYFSDSSVDWGQDLKRLKTYVADHPQINHIAIDYFGGGVPAYYFCDRKKDATGHIIPTAAGYDCSMSVMEEWHSQYGEYTGQYIAVSETFLENDKYYTELNDTPGYQYLRDRTPIAKIGNSIYLYKLY